MHGEGFNYVLDNPQAARWKLSEEKLNESLRFKERQYASGLEKIKELERNSALKREITQCVLVPHSGLLC